MQPLFLSRKGFTHPVHRLVDTLNGSHGTRPSGSGFSVASDSRCRTFRVPFRLSPLLKRSCSSVEQFPSIATGHPVHAPSALLSIPTTNRIISNLHPEVAMLSLPLKTYATTSMASSYGTWKPRTHQPPSSDIKPALSCPTFSSSGSHGRESLASL